MKRPEPRDVVNILKDFQRASVDVVFRRMFDDKDPSHRFLLADEVGLGKTLVARGVVAKAVDHLWDKVPRIDIVYICSNADIARQNIRRLNISREDDFVFSTRITQLPLEVSGLKKRKLNFIAFTPGTSFDLKTAAGTAHERALLYWLLRDEWNLRGAGPLNVLQGGSSTDRFRERIAYFDTESIDKDIASAFHLELTRHGETSRAVGGPDLKERFLNLCRRLPRTRKVTKEERREISGVVGELRAVLAATCIRALEPDLVILDEFQRFKHLLSGDQEDSELARELFNYEGLEGRTRVLLLSATPYKMYTGAGDSPDEDHYEDFIQTLSFLQNDPAATERTRASLARYRSALFLASEDVGHVIDARDEIQSELTRVMCRTERLAQSVDRSGMLLEVTSDDCDLTDADVRSYEGIQELCKVLEHIDPTEYWKSAPYVLGLMDDYDLKRRFRDSLESGDCETVLATIRAYPALAVPRSLITGVGDAAHPHSRLRWLLRDTVETGAWRLLWIPPSAPYYSPEGPFSDPRLGTLTKKLVFSAWRIVPKAIALLVSHEAERKLFASDAMGGSVHDVRARTTAPLEFRQDGERFAGMPVFGIVYPSRYLAIHADPLAIRASEGPISAKQMRARIAQIVSAPVDRIVRLFSSESKEVDENWYWAAPLLLDRQHYGEATASFFDVSELSTRWAGVHENDEASTGWLAHLNELQIFLRHPTKLGSPPEDLLDVLVEQALGGAGTVAFRALRRSGTPDAYRSTAIQVAAARIGWAFRTFFNLPESVAAIRHEPSEEVFWRRTLHYAAGGNLQSVMDEYLHVLRESEGLYEGEPEAMASQLADAVTKALSLRTARVVVDDVRSAKPGKPIKQHRMRARFAARFGHQEETESGDLTPADHTRAAFNSPFWPFVLATTSVGQEGLDFHPYCHAVVHWNVPSNPVDMEQREGRVHRYKGHAVRRNVASAHASSLTPDVNDPWMVMFSAAAGQRAEGESEIVPYWVYQTGGGAAIERHVPFLPLSRDLERLSALRRSLAMYRVVFGQPRQDELLEYLHRHLPATVAEKIVRAAAINLAPTSSAL